MLGHKTLQCTNTATSLEEINQGKTLSLVTNCLNKLCSTLVQLVYTLTALKIICKVESNQPSCWLYSMPNLLVFQQLETLYLGGNHVRVVCVRECEKLLKCVQRSRDSRLDFASGSQLQAAKLKHTCQACQKLKRRANCSLQDKSSRLARPFARGLNSRLNPVVRSSRQNILFGKI